MDDEYELLPHEELLRLREELKKLRTGKEPSLQDSINKLNRNIEELVSIFQKAARETSDEDFHLDKKLEVVLDENRKIAEAIVAVADMLEPGVSTPTKTRMAEPPQRYVPPMRPRPTEPLMGSRPTGAPMRPRPEPSMRPRPTESPMPPLSDMPEYGDLLADLPPLPTPPPQTPRGLPPLSPGTSDLGELPSLAPPAPGMPPGSLPPLPPRKKGLFRR